MSVSTENLGVSDELAKVLANSSDQSRVWERKFAIIRSGDGIEEDKTRQILGETIETITGDDESWFMAIKGSLDIELDLRLTQEQKEQMYENLFPPDFKGRDPEMNAQIGRTLQERSDKMLTLGGVTYPSVLERDAYLFSHISVDQKESCKNNTIARLHMEAVAPELPDHLRDRLVATRDALLGIDFGQYDSYLVAHATWRGMRDWVEQQSVTDPVMREAQQQVWKQHWGVSE